MKQTAKEIIIVALSIALVMAAVIAAVGGVNAAANRIAQRSRRLREQAQPSSQQTANGAEDLPVLSRAKVGWGLGPAKNELGQPADAAAAQEKYGGLGGRFLMGEDKVIYLTFDCGYENGYTADILDTLREKQVQGTFFITGEYLDEAPHLAARMLQEGHVLGNHTEKHPSLPDTDAARLQREIGTLHERVQRELGYEMRLFRFPMGEFSQQTLQQVQQLGYESVFWSFAYKDWLTDDQPDKASALAKLTGALHPGGIYLLHTVSSANAAVLGSFIDAARQAGYRFGAILQDMGLEPPAQQTPQILDGNLAA